MRFGVPGPSPAEEALATGSLFQGLQPPENQRQQEINHSSPFSPSGWQLPEAF